MAYCVDHKVYFHEQVNEKCYICEKIQKECKHEKTHIDPLFNSRKYLGLQGEWEICDACNDLVRIDRVAQ